MRSLIIHFQRSFVETYMCMKTYRFVHGENITLAEIHFQKNRIYEIYTVDIYRWFGPVDIASY